MTKWQGFYSFHQVSRLAGISLRTLYFWKKAGIFRPSARIVNADGSVVEGYSYSDLAIVKLLNALKIKRLNLKSAALACRHLYERFGSPKDDRWASAHVYIVGKEVFAYKPDDWDTTLATKYGQKAERLVLGLSDLFEEDAALIVPRAFSDYIEVDPNVMEGQPVVKNTRVPTFMFALLLKEGWGIGEIANWYSPIPTDAIMKAVEFETVLDNARTKTTAETRAFVN